MEIIWTDLVRNGGVLRGVKEESNVLHTVNGWEAIWIGHILRRNCRVKYLIKGKIESRTEMTGRQGRRRKQLLDDLKARRGSLEL
jgi:hypothetical protein